MASANGTFDPTQIAPDFTAQREALKRMYGQGLINLNAKKNNLLSSYGFQNNTGDYNISGAGANFSNLQVDPNQQYGAYRNELTSEANQLDAADNGPDRGFSGGVANQASAAAKRAMAARQSGFMQNLQQQLGGLNQEAGNQGFNFAEGYNQIGADEGDYQGGQALWQALNTTAPPPVPGVSGGGSTPLVPQQAYNRTGPEAGGNLYKPPKKPVLGGRGRIT